jgi:hypothetical protein
LKKAKEALEKRQIVEEEFSIAQNRTREPK